MAPRTVGHKHSFVIKLFTRVQRGKGNGLDLIRSSVLTRLIGDLLLFLAFSLYSNTVCLEKLRPEIGALHRLACFK